MWTTNGNIWRSIRDWFGNTFGGAVFQQFEYESSYIDIILGGVNVGGSHSALIRGNADRRIIFYAVNASSPWRFWEFRVGVRVNIGDGGFGFNVGVAGAENYISANGTTVSVIGSPFDRFGIKVSQGVNFRENSVESFHFFCLRPLRVVAVLLSVVGVVMEVGVPVPSPIPAII